MSVGSRKSSSSLRSSPHPLSRSVSGPSTPEARKRTKSRSSAPPTSWQRRTVTSNASQLSTGSAASNRSLALSIPESASTTSHETLASRRDKDAEMCTPSTSSTNSMPMTPHDTEATVVPAAKPWEKAKEKALPALPRRMASNSSLRSVSSSHRQIAVPVPVPRARTVSAAPSMSTPGVANRISVPEPSVPPMPATPRSPRPLRLPQAHAQSLSKSPAGARTDSYVPSSTQSVTRSTGPPVRQISRMPSASRLARPSFTPPSSSGPAPIVGPKPKPRTGAGMVYRSSSSNAGSTSRLRLPSAASSVSDLHGDMVGVGIAI
ncbi:hypothetical protein OE88DRAFT_1103217 [Heliocybe sulcata]|uniref:Uncharacterized protein n=1 Tax=Heliocybe sulcata TaxID=5364 RepID=A0A5C3MJQ3_9AGAM|nr:hypothetical protein OE88DRAFT_1103217 [Heliocybe sulcata]